MGTKFLSLFAAGLLLAASAPSVAAPFPDNPATKPSLASGVDPKDGGQIGLHTKIDSMTGLTGDGRGSVHPTAEVTFVELNSPFSSLDIGAIISLKRLTTATDQALMTSINHGVGTTGTTRAPAVDHYTFAEPTSTMIKERGTIRAPSVGTAAMPMAA
ncbi:hypothetical protein K8Q93_02245 [Candidatus Parcubacteria bacterium]|nr:hypothetical protein [Candidatus Parcubacteria bacterium]